MKTATSRNVTVQVPLSQRYFITWSHTQTPDTRQAVQFGAVLALSRPFSATTYNRVSPFPNSRKVPCMLPVDAGKRSTGEHGRLTRSKGKSTTTTRLHTQGRSTAPF